MKSRTAQGAVTENNYRGVAAIIVATVLLFSCGRHEGSGQDGRIEQQKRAWIVEMKEEFPEKTTDTVELSRRLEHFLTTGNKVGQLMMYRVLGNEARNSSMFRTAIEYHTAGLQLAYEILDTVNITVVMNDLATDFRRIGAFDEAAPYHYLALQIAEEYRGPETLLIERNMASAYNGIGSICRAMNEHDEAIRVYEKALELEMKHGNNRGMAINHANIGAIHFNRGDYAAAERDYIISLEYNQKAELPMGIALCLMNIGNVFEVQGRLDDALAEYEEAYDVLADTPDKWHWLDACFHGAQIHLKKGNFAQAAEYLDRGLRTAREITSMKHMWRAHELLSEYHYKRGDFRRAVDDMRTMQAYADTMQHSLETNRLLESRVNYETSKYAKQIDELDALNHKQTVKRRVAMLMTIPVIAMLIVLLLLARYRRKLESRRAGELKNLERMRSNFFTNITHEFRTPITVIKGLADHLRTTVKHDDTPETRDIDAIRRQSRHMIHLVNQLLEFSRSEAGVDRPRWRQGDVVEFLQVVIEPYAQYARSRGVDLFLYSEVESLTLNFAPSHIKKVIGNLLSNAIKHCPEGSRIIVHLYCDMAARKYYIQVKDNGEGIPAEKLPHIFELYYTSATDNSGTTGSGIGLSLSRQLVEEIGGTVGVESTQGKGAEFMVTLPVLLAEIPEDERDDSDDDYFDELACGSDDGCDPELWKSKGKKTILIVEDNKDVAHYVSTVLAGKYSLLYATNGYEGLHLAEQHTPDLIITDVMMPEKDGYAFTTELRGSVAVSHIPVVMLTAKDTTEDKLEGLKAGVDVYLPKPFDERELLAHIRQLLRSRSMLMETYSSILLQDGMQGGRSEAVGSDHNMAFISKLANMVVAHLDDASYFPEGLSRDMCLSESQLGRKLKAMTGHTITSYVMRARLNRAKQLLSRRDRSIKEVALACGFSDLSYFSRSFRKVFGYTPSQFMKIPEQPDI